MPRTDSSPGDRRPFPTCTRDALTLRRSSGMAALRTVASVAAVASLAAGDRLIAQEPEPIQAGVAPAPGPYAPGVDVLHYEVELGLGRGVAWFEGIAGVHVAIEGDSPTLPLDFTGLAVTRVTAGDREATYTYDSGVLRVPLPGASVGDEVVVTVHYRGVPDDGLIIRENVHGEPTAFVDNWPNRTRFWLPSVDHPADKATVRYTVHAPAEWHVIANGHLVGEPEDTPREAIGPDGERRSWVWEVGVPISPYNMVVGAADMAVESVGLAACGRAPASRRADGCIEVSYWVYPQDLAKAAPSFRRAAQMVDHFTDVIGPYPFEKLANVQSATRFGGMENASAIFYSERALSSGRNIEGTVSHEIAHQWFGDAVTEASWHHLWLSEGFATYFGAQFFEAADGIEAFRDRMEQGRRRVVGSPDVARPVIDPVERDLFALLNDNNYAKGGWVLHMLRGIVGDEIFFAGIREYYRRHLHSAVLTSDFQAIMEEVSGRDLGWFFHQWLFEPGFPTFELDVKWTPEASGSAGRAIVTIRQVQREAWPIFRVPMQLLASGETGQLVRRDIEAVERVTEVDLGRLEAEPTAVMLDPDGWVLKGGS